MDAHTVRLLKQLRNDLHQAESLTESDLDLREQLLEDIEALLQSETSSASPARSAKEYHPAIERLNEAVRRFEVSHPNIAASMGRVINSLSNMGI
jgi:hypothetical protein